MPTHSAARRAAPDPAPPGPFVDLRDLRLGQVRASIGERCYQRSTFRALAWLAMDAAVYAVALLGVFTADTAPGRLAWGVAAGIGVSMLFIWAHDAAHASLFRSRAWSELLGTLAMGPSLQMYRLWILGHNRVHHGFTSFSPMDWIWRPLRPEEYQALSPARRALYRAERHPAGCGLHYLLRVWWPGMVRYRIVGHDRRSRALRVSRLVTVAAAVVAVVIAYRFAGGLAGVAAGVVVPFLVFTWVIAMVVYLHHTHPDVPFFMDRDEWSPAIGQLACTTVIRTGRLLEVLSHNILIHVPHHVDSRIPFYRLAQAYADLQPTYTGYVREYRLRWSTVRAVFSSCQLYDFDARRWSRFADAGTGSRPPAGASRPGPRSTTEIGPFGPGRRVPVAGSSDNRRAGRRRPKE